MCVCGEITWRHFYPPPSLSSPKLKIIAFMASSRDEFYCLPNFKSTKVARAWFLNFEGKENHILVPILLNRGQKYHLLQNKLCTIREGVPFIWGHLVSEVINVVEIHNTYFSINNLDK